MDNTQLLNKLQNEKQIIDSKINEWYMYGIDVDVLNDELHQKHVDLLKELSNILFLRIENITEKDNHG